MITVLLALGLSRSEDANKLTGLRILRCFSFEKEARAPRCAPCLQVFHVIEHFSTSK